MRPFRYAGACALVAMSGACALVAGIEDVTVVPRDDTLPDGGTTTEDGAIADSDTPADGGTDAGPPLPECRAQRVVHLVCGNGGFAWFALVWPESIVITAFQTQFAFDNPANAVKAPSPAAHLLYARKRANRYLWEGAGKNPMPTAFVIGTNQTHTGSPITTSVVTAGVSVDMLAAGAAVQAKNLAPKVPVISFDALSYTKRPGDPAMTVAANMDAAVSAVQSAASLTLAQADALRPDQAKLATWYATTTPPVKHTDLAAKLLFAANVFKGGYVGTVMLGALRDDPHGAFSNGVAAVTATADDLVSILDNFYVELGKSNEKECGHNGLPLSLADNTIFVVSGDTTKDPFNNAGWPDGTPGGSNVVYVRSNGFLQSGWFGSRTPPPNAAKTNFDPATGALNAGIANNVSQAGALDALLFAIARGDQNAVTAIDATSYAGIRSATPP